MTMWNILHRKLSELVEVKSVLRDHIPIIRRFTGGGTVVVDNGTIFVTLICNKDDVSHVQPFPRSIMAWSGLLYSKVFEGLADFHLRENGILIESCIDMLFIMFLGPLCQFLCVKWTQQIDSVESCFNSTVVILLSSSPSKHVCYRKHPKKNWNFFISVYFHIVSFGTSIFSTKHVCRHLKFGAYTALDRFPLVHLNSLFKFQYLFHKFHDEFLTGFFFPLCSKIM